LVRIQDNHDADAEIAGELSGFENESELEYTDEVYLSEDDLELDSEEVNWLVLSTLMAARDFQEQKGRLQQELEPPGQEVIFYPKFHCKLNFIETFWFLRKTYTRDHCTFKIQGLRKILPEAIKPVSAATINRYYHRCMRTLDAYFTGHTCGSTVFKNHVISMSHWQVNKLKW
jgi:hypothetical protein